MNRSRYCRRMGQVEGTRENHSRAVPFLVSLHRDSHLPIRKMMLGAARPTSALTKTTAEGSTSPDERTTTKVSLILKNVREPYMDSDTALPLVDNVSANEIKASAKPATLD